MIHAMYLPSLHPATPQVMAELDEQSRKAVEEVWVQVNEWFGQIFSTLLPGTSAKLEPPAGCTYEDGALMHVHTTPHS